VCDTVSSIEQSVQDIGIVLSGANAVRILWGTVLAVYRQIDGLERENRLEVIEKLEHKTIGQGKSKMKKCVLFPIIVASMLTFWHVVPAQAQGFYGIGFRDIISHYCYQKNNAVPDGYYDCRYSGEYIPPGYEGWMSTEVVTKYFATDPPDESLFVQRDIGVAVYAVCTWVGGALAVTEYTLSSDAFNIPADVAFGRIEDPWFYSNLIESNDEEGHFDKRIEGSMPPLPC
jgi:hypothetical protein